jgi:phospholipase C
VVSGDYGPPPFVNYTDTIFYQLDSAGISWGYFEYLQGFKDSSNVYPLNYISGSSTIDNIQNISSLLNYLRTGKNLPSVSFVSSIGTRALDEHPPYNVTEGELWVVSIVNALMRSNYWNSSAIFLTWDEGGGYYDHVAPPKAFITNHDFDHPLLSYGQRLPLIVISPYAKENYVSETLLSHLSILHYIEYNWILKPLNSAVAQANLPLDLFYFNTQPRPPLILNSTGPYSYKSYPVPLQIPLEHLEYKRSGSLINTPDQYLVPTLDIATIAIIVATIIYIISTRFEQRKRTSARRKM